MIVKTITDDYYFWNWVKKSDSYSTCFTLEGAKALQAHLQELSEELEEPMQFDPIAWCCEWTEYANIAELNEQMGTNYSLDPSDDRKDLSDVTTVIEAKGDRFIVQDF